MSMRSVMKGIAVDLRDKARASMLSNPYAASSSGAPGLAPATRSSIVGAQNQQSEKQTATGGKQDVMGYAERRQVRNQFINGTSSMMSAVKSAISSSAARIRA